MASLEEQPIATITAISTFDPTTTNTSADIASNVTTTSGTSAAVAAAANALVGNLSTLDSDFGLSACAEKQLLTPGALLSGGNSAVATLNINTTATTTGAAVDSIVEKLVSSLTLDMDSDPLGNGNTTMSRDFNCNGSVTSDHKSVSSRSSSLAGNMFSEVFEKKANDLESGSLEDSCSSIGADCMDKNCKICR